tara:strand:+ start:53 stop:262 length:210 start_codon:yes stop_codon:yes gene_type:complete
MTNEQKFKENVNIFLQIIKNFHGNSPTFSIDYKREEINLISCPSGFIRNLQKEGAITHLHKGALSVDFF